MTQFHPRDNECMTEFVARDSEAWADLEPAEPEAFSPDPDDAAWAAETSPLNFVLDCPSNPTWDESWTITGAEEWIAIPDDPKSLWGPVANLSEAEYHEVAIYCEKHLPPLASMPTHVLRVVYSAVWSELMDRDSAGRN